MAAVALQSLLGTFELRACFCWLALDAIKEPVVRSYTYFYLFRAILDRWVSCQYCELHAVIRFLKYKEVKLIDIFIWPNR